MFLPPSTTRSWPVTKSIDKKARTAWATCWALAQPCKGVEAATRASVSSANLGLIFSRGQRVTTWPGRPRELDDAGLREPVDDRRPRRPVTGDGADVDDGPVRLLQVGAGHPGAVESPFQVRVDDLPPEVLGLLVQVHERVAGGAGVVHQHVEAAEPVDRVGDHLLDLVFVADVGLKRQGLDTELAQALRGRLRVSFRTVVVDDDRAGPGPGQALAHRLPDPGAAPRHDRDRAFQFHSP